MCVYIYTYVRMHMHMHTCVWPTDLRLEDAADDDDARALDEHGEERAHERLREAEQPRVLWWGRGAGSALKARSGCG